MSRTTFTFSFLAALALTAISPVSYYIWFFESLSPIGIFIILFCAWRRLALRRITLMLALVQLAIMLIGAHYSFKDVPFLRVTLPGMPERSVFDWVSHFFVAIPITFAALDVLLNNRTIMNNWVLFLYALGCCLTPALCWELVEALACVVSSDAFDFRGGCEWDTHIDLGMTLLGCILCFPLANRNRAVA